MNKMIFLLLVLSLFACRNNPSDQVRQQAAQNITQAQSAINEQASSSGLTLSIGRQTAAKGDKICLPVTAEGFLGLISMQYTIRWDPKVLRLDKVDQFTLPWLSEDNFGLHVTDEGLATFVWIDNDLQGVNVSNGSPLYQLCFEVIGESGQESAVTLSEDPTPFEVVTVEEKVIPLKGAAGKITVQ